MAEAACWGRNRGNARGAWWVVNKMVAAIGVVLIGAVALLFVHNLRTSRLTPAQLEEEALAMARLKKAEEAEKAKEEPKAEETAAADAEKPEPEQTLPPAESAQEALVFTELKEPPKTEQGGVPDVFTVKFECSNGDFYVEFNRKWAPNGAKRVYQLITEKFFDECRFFRYAKSPTGEPFVAQWGIAADPKVDAQWHNKNIKDDPVKQKNLRGTVTFAASGQPDSRSTQLFINFRDNTQLDGMGFAPVGKVIQGMDVADAIHSEYGEDAEQMMIHERGNAYLNERFPNMDYIKRAVFVEAAATEPAEQEPSQQRNAAAAAHKETSVKLITNKGTIEIELFPNEAPVTVASFVNLAKRGYYDGLTFHRVIGDFMIQGGCPYGTGTGDPGYKFEDECVPSLKFDRPGLLAMANAGPRTNGSQFFITHVPTPHLNGKHTIFGEVVQGQDVVNAIQKGDTIERIEIVEDFSELFENQKNRVADWNATLDRRKNKS